MLDRDGIILFSADSDKYIGKNISGPEIQSMLPKDIKDQFNGFVSNSLNGLSGEVDFEYRGNSTTISYDPVSFSGYNFIILYVSIPHNITTTTFDFANQPKILSLISITIVGIISTIIMAVILSTNKRLRELVESQTRDLKISNKSLRESNQQLKILEKSEREFINIAAHELKTPIQSIVLVGEDIEEDIKKGTKIELSQEYAEIILRNSKRLSSLTNSLLKMSKIENNSLTLNKEKVNLREKVSNVIQDVKKIIQPEQDLVIDFKPNLEKEVFVNADRNMIFEVLSNLLMNAIKFTKQGVILVNIMTKDGFALVTIRDTGIGIPPEIEYKIFEKFFSSGNGTGIGLFLSKNIIELHGGKLWFEKNEDGKGTTFSFTLPLSNIE